MKLNIKSNKLQKVSAIHIPDRFYNRMSTGVAELDSLFGGGILPGSTFTLTAAPGTGKTTFFLQLLENMSKLGYNCGFATGEEDINQIAFTCKRLGVHEVPVCNETNIDEICKLTEELDVLVIDSFPCLTTNKNLTAHKKEAYMVQRIIDAAERNECVVGIVLHITKSGKYKGSTLIPHAVSANFQLDRDDDDSQIRIFSAQKNRYGCTENLAIGFGSKGFNFKEISKVDQSSKKDTKAYRKSEQLDAIMKMSDVNGITQQQVIKQLGVDTGKAYILLKELTNTEQLIKFGRGATAVWKKVELKAVEE
jgi:DNA repair protein RadA/Sms